MESCWRHATGDVHAQDQHQQPCTVLPCAAGPPSTGYPFTALADSWHGPLPDMSKSAAVTMGLVQGGRMLQDPALCAGVLG